MTKATRIVREALDLPPAQRETFILKECGDDIDLRARVARLLAVLDEEKTSGASQLRQPETQEQRNASFTGTKRFTVQRHLGSGAFGAVYQIWDAEQKVTLAAKVLRNYEADVLLRFKREFREIVELHHDNLVRLYELFSEAEQWFFTMELIEGPNFLGHVRPKPESCRHDRLRPALLQLVRGVRALHAAKRLHRDLKPANVLVARDGRVVLLDFGLLLDLNSASQRSITMVGTPAYMSPEQASHESLKEASDWYSVGVMLYQVLTGALPASAFSMDRSQSDFNRGWSLEWPTDAPADLRELCRRLLARDPDDRPAGDEIERQLTEGNPLTAFAGRELEIRTTTAECFVGRKEELELLARAYAEVQEGHQRVVLLEGPSGIGKTTTINQFIRQQSSTTPKPLVFKGRCYEFESVPYKGVDALIDELAQYLGHLPEPEVNAILPREAALLPTLFPVLARVEAIATAPLRSSTIPDEQERRHRTFAALRELLARLSDRHPLILWIDDLQWSDRDSSLLLADLGTPPGPPALLLILTYRSEDAAANATLQHLHQSLKTLEGWHQRILPDLDAGESRDYIDEMLKAKPEVGQELRERILTECGGHPLFLQQLTFQATKRSGLTLPGEGSDLQLRSLLKQRIRLLPASAREALEYICLAAQPLSTPILCEVAARSVGEDKRPVIDLLLQEHLLRVSGVKDRRLEPYHDQVRSAVKEMVGGAKRRELHGRLASVFSKQPQIESQVLVTHFLQAENPAAAYQPALQAAALAEQQLAFERASFFYQIALEANPEQEEQANLFRKLADTLGKAGRGYDAAHAYIKSAERDVGNSFELRGLAAHQLMRSGHLDEAMALIEELAAKCHVKMVKGRADAMIKIVTERVRTRALLAWRAQGFDDRVPSDENVRRLELLRIGAVELTMADPVQAACFQVQYIGEALRKGDAVHRSTALAIEATIRASRGRPAEAFRFLDAAEKLATECGSTNAVGLTLLGRVYVDYQLGRLKKGQAHAEEAVSFLREKCTGVTWELTTVYLLLFAFRGWTGQIKGMREELMQLLKEGAARGDVNVEVSLRLLSCNHYAYLSSDESAECLLYTRESLAQWSKRGFHLQHFGGLYITIETHLYMGEYAAARSGLMAKWAEMSRSLILNWRILMTLAYFLRGRVMLACWFLDRKNRALEADVESCKEKLQRMHFSWARPMSTLLRAGLAAGRGSRREALQGLTEAHQQFSAIEMHGYAAAARYARSFLRSDAGGRAEAQESILFFQSQGVKNCEAFLKLFLPGWEEVWATDSSGLADPLFGLPQ